MARKPEPRPQPRDVEQVLRELAKVDRVRGLLDVGKPGMGKGLLSLPIPANTGTGAPPAPSTIAPILPGRPAILDEIENRFAGTPGMETPQNGGGLLGLSPKPSRGLLAPVTATGQKSLTGPLAGPPASMPQAQSGPVPQRRPLAARAGNFLDDILFGGAAGDLRAGRRERDEEQAAAAAHREAFAFAQTPQGFDPNRYGARLAELGQAPDMSGIVNLEGVNDGRDVRGLRNRQEERGVIGSVAASLARTPEAERPAAYEGAQAYLDSQGQGYRLPGPGGLQPAIATALGADGYLQNDRGERVFGEEQRQAQAAEQFRDRDLGFRRDESQADRDFRERQFTADNEYRNSRAAAEDAYRRWEQENSFTRSDIEGQVLRKAIASGAGSLSPEERQVYDRAVTVAANPYAALMGGGMPGGMPSAPSPVGAVPAAAPSPAPGDPFPGISEGQVVVQDGVRYQRRGNQMLPVG